MPSGIIRGMYIVFEAAPEILHIRRDEDFTFCGAMLNIARYTHPFTETDEEPEGKDKCNVCFLRRRLAEGSASVS